MRQWHVEWAGQEEGILITVKLNSNLTESTWARPTINLSSLPGPSLPHVLWLLFPFRGPMGLYGFQTKTLSSFVFKLCSHEYWKMAGLHNNPMSCVHVNTERYFATAGEVKMDRGGRALIRVSAKVPSFLASKSCSREC